MKIINLKIENFKRIKAVEIKSDKNFIEITGRNGQGKTSVLDAIESALCGKASLPERPLRDGSTSGHIEVDIGDYVVHRKFNESGSSLMIVSKSGDVKTSPQEFLNNIVGKLSFDPLKFVLMESKKRIEIFKSVLGINTDKLTEEHQSLYLQRRDVSAVLERVKVLYNSLIEHNQDVNVPDISQIQLDRDAAIRNNNRLREAEARSNNILDQIMDIEIQIVGLTEKKANLEAEHKQIIELVANSKTINVSQFDDELKNIQNLMHKKSKHQDYLTAKKEFDSTLDRYTTLQTAIEKNMDATKALLQSVKMPIEGLELKDNQLYLKGIPFDQLSQAEQLTVSMSMAIAENPQLKFVRIENGSLLDHDSIELLKKISLEPDFQVWIETVSDNKGKPDALYIEDGGIA